MARRWHYSAIGGSLPLRETPATAPGFFILEGDRDEYQSVPATDVHVLNLDPECLPSVTVVTPGQEFDLSSCVVGEGVEWRARTTGSMRRWRMDSGRLFAPSGGDGHLDITVSVASNGQWYEISALDLEWRVQE